MQVFNRPYQRNTWTYSGAAKCLFSSETFSWRYKCENWHEQSPWVTWQANCPRHLKFQGGGHFSRQLTTLVEQLRVTMVYLVIQAWKLAWAVSVGHLTISHHSYLEFQDSHYLSEAVRFKKSFSWWYKYENCHEPIYSLWKRGKMLLATKLLTWMQ